MVAVWVVVVVWMPVASPTRRRLLPRLVPRFVPRFVPRSCVVRTTILSHEIIELAFQVLSIPPGVANLDGEAIESAQHLAIALGHGGIQIDLRQTMGEVSARRIQGRKGRG